MTPFHVGMRVVCVDVSRMDCSDGTIGPVKGVVYTVRNFRQHDAIRLVEIVNVAMRYADGFNECGFKLHRFRPAHENRMDELRSLLAPVPSKAKTLSPVTS